MKKEIMNMMNQFTLTEISSIMVLTIIIKAHIEIDLLVIEEDIMMAQFKMNTIMKLITMNLCTKEVIILFMVNQHITIAPNNLLQENIITIH